MSFPIIKLRQGAKSDAELVLQDIKNKLGSFESFRFLDHKQIHKIIKSNYDIDDDVLFCVTFKLLLEYLDDNEFLIYKDKKDRISLNDLRDAN